MAATADDEGTGHVPLHGDAGRRHGRCTLDDDGDLQFWSASGFAHSLRDYARARGLNWYVASMLPILFPWPGLARKRQLSPDTFVAFVPEHPRSSFDAEAEGGFPPFVLEVVSPSSTERDEVEKCQAYEFLGVREYALFTPRDGAPSRLEGYRLGPDSRFGPWFPDATGRLWSETLGLFLVTNGALVQAQTPEGQLLLTPEQANAALRDAQEERQRVEVTLGASEAARQRTEEELAALRRELARLCGEAEG
jgi:Uma2 family endonuclease